MVVDFQHECLSSHFSEGEPVIFALLARLFSVLLALLGVGAKKSWSGGKHGGVRGSRGVSGRGDGGPFTWRHFEGEIIVLGVLVESVSGSASAILKRCQGSVVCRLITRRSIAGYTTRLASRSGAVGVP